jgi:diguanylate cyclase (GGDEF)-like protein
MRLVGRNDAFLLGGLAVALFVLFARPLGQALSLAQAADQRRGLQLLPALVILTAVLIVHLVRRRRQMRSEARAAHARADELAQLVAFGQALARSLELGAIRVAAEEYLPRLAPGRTVWVMIRGPHHWEPLIGPRDGLDLREQAAARALGETAAPTDGRAEDVCLPMIVAGTPVGVLGVSPDPPLDEERRSGLTAAAALLGVSVKNAELFAEAREASARDPLTTCFTRKHALDMMAGELRRAKRSSHRLTLVMLDLDDFKAINDRFGHLCGDSVLASVGQRMSAVLRGSDIKCRYGGDEFLVLLPDTPAAGAHRVAETLRRELEERPVRWQDQSIVVTASFGIAELREDDVEIEGLVARADAALYRAKQGGRNRVEAADHTTVP